MLSFFSRWRVADFAGFAVAALLLFALAGGAAGFDAGDAGSDSDGEPLNSPTDTDASLSSSLSEASVTNAGGGIRGHFQNALAVLFFVGFARPTLLAYTRWVGLRMRVRDSSRVRVVYSQR